MSADDTDKRKDWLARRRLAVGASDVAAILGIPGAYGSPLDVYRSKVLGIEAPETDAMFMGREIEGAIAKLYAKNTNRELEDPGPYTIQRHPSAPLATTLDRLIVGPDLRGPLQIKSVGGSMSRGWSGNEPPLVYQVQVQAEMAVTGDPVGVLCGWVAGQRLIDFLIPRDEEFQAQMIVAVISFWTNHVERRNPPPPGPGDANALQDLYPKESGVYIALGHDAERLANERDGYSETMSAAKVGYDRTSNLLKAMLGSATWGVLPDGTRMQWRTETRKEHVVKESSRRVLRRLKAAKKRLKA